MFEPKILEIARALGQAGGRALVVGGFVRDHLLGRQSKDIDIEVHGLSLDAVEAVLARFGRVLSVGKAFGVFRLDGLDVDISLPRRDSKVGAGHRGFDVSVDPHLGIAEATERRDLTINSILMDPLTGEIIDPQHGQADLEAGVLRATSPRYFAEDPLRGLRVVQFAARFEMTPDVELLDLCRPLDISELPGERIFAEMRKLLSAQRPSLGLAVLKDSDQLRFFPELAALVGVRQDPLWHPEGDVFTHTAMVVDAAAELRRGEPDDEALMFAALCHDLGKPTTTTFEHGRIRSKGHEAAGVDLCRNWLTRLVAPNALVEQVATLVARHLAPVALVTGKATPKAYRRLARHLSTSGVSLALLERLARADALGRSTDDAKRGVFPTGDLFLQRASELEVTQQPPNDVVLGRHLIARGLQPGKQFGAILARCRDLQDETGWDDSERILDAVLDD